MKRVTLLILLISFILVPRAHGANLYTKFKDAPAIKIYLKRVTNEVNDPRVKTSAFKDVFKDVLSKRLNINFESAGNPTDADCVINATIKKYSFKKRAMPIPVSPWAIIADATAMKSSAKLVVDYLISDPATGDILAKFKGFTISERRPIKDMAGDEGFKHAAFKNINRLIYRAFYKQKTSRPY